MDRSSEARTSRQVIGQTRVEVDLNEPRSQFESLAARLELYMLFTDDKLKSMVNYYTPRIEELEGSVTALGPQITTLLEFDLVFMMIYKIYTARLTRRREMSARCQTPLS